MKSEIGCALAPEPQALSQHIFLQKYAGPGERTHQDVRIRVAKALASDENQETRFLATQQAGFVPGGRINSAAGHKRVSTMINCFVQPIEDTMTGSIKGLPGIMGALAEATETMRRGGGVGYDFSRLRPSGAKVKGTESTASGPVSYMRVFDRSCSTVESAGERRGAQMGVLRVDHPDIEMFVDSKRAPDFSTLGLNAQEGESLAGLIRGKPDFAWAMRSAFATLSNFNISVGITDAFMHAVVADEEFDLVHEAPPAFDAATTVGQDGVARYVYRRIRAKDLWTKIMRNTYESADPGVLFLDTINRLNNLRYCETIHASNPCGEQLLPAYGACCLGSQNLTWLVRMPFTGGAYFDFEAFDVVVAGAVEMLDRVLDVTNWPLAQQEAEARSKRRIGVGFFGLASAMAMLGLRYGSPESAQFASTVARRMRDAAYRASVELAKKLGPFDLFDAEHYLADGTFASTLPQEIQDSIRQFGIRNSHLLSIAPTGTTALAFADNASSGIEPIFDLTTFRNVRTGRGNERETWQAEDYAWRVQQLVQGKDARPDAFVTAQQLTVDEHLRIVEAVAPFVDSAISKTVNVPKDYPFEEFEAIYLDAWKRGLKGITTYRPNDMVGAVLVSQEDHASSMSATELRADDPDRRVEIRNVPNVVERLKWPSRPDVVAAGVTYSVRHPGGDHAVVVNHWVTGVRRHPLEVYIAGNEQPRGLAAIAKSISVDMRTEDSRFLAMKLDSLLNTRGDDGFEMTDPGTGLRVRMPSLTAGFAALVKHRLVELGALEGGGQSPFIDALFSKREPKTGAEGAIGWHVDIKNPATGDDFLLHTKELKLPDGTIRPYSVWLSGQYPKVLDGLMKVLSIDMRISDPGWVAMKLRKLTDFGEVRGDFLAQVPGEARQQNYPSTVAYIAEVLLARMNKLGLLGREFAAQESPPVVASPGLLSGSGRLCPSCHSLSLHKVAGCDVCSNCEFTGSCG